MDERVMQFRVGVMVLASLLIVGILLLLLGELELPRFLRRTDTVRLWFPEGRGLSEGALVRKNGILVGRVREVRFIADKDLERPQGVDEAEFNTGILVTAEIQEDVKLYKHDACRIQTDLLGKPSLHFFRPEDRRASKELLDISKVQKGEIASDPLDSLSMVMETIDDLRPNIEELSTAMTNAGNSIDEAARRLTALLGDKSERGIESAIAEANSSLRAIQRIFGSEDQEGALEAALKEVPDTVRQFKTTMQTAQQRLDELKMFTEKLGSEETIAGLDRAAGKLEAVIDNLAEFSEGLKNPQGSLMLLQKDRQLYDRLNSVAANVDDLSRKLKPIVNDIRVFTDKVARHPERIGVRGVLQRYPGIK
jgi:phospholipid/cholesterol/gamma-HCH transport system substrate-binding protein